MFLSYQHTNQHSHGLRLCLLAGLIGLTGCARVAHVQELLTLKRYSDNQEEQAEFVDAQNRRFDTLLDAVKDKTLDQYRTREGIAAAFGDPVFSRNVVRDDVAYEMWLYRYATRFFGSEKVYFYFDDQGDLTGWEHYVPPEGP